MLAARRRRTFQADWRWRVWSTGCGSLQGMSPVEWRACDSGHLLATAYLNSTQWFWARICFYYTFTDMIHLLQECTSRLQAVRDKIKERLPRVVVRTGGQVRAMSDTRRHLLSLRFSQLNICRASANNKSCIRKVLTHPRRQRKSQPWKFSERTRL